MFVISVFSSSDVTERLKLFFPEDHRCISETLDITKVLIYRLQSSSSMVTSKTVKVWIDGLSGQLSTVLPSRKLKNPMNVQILFYEVYQISIQSSAQTVL